MPGPGENVAFNEINKCITPTFVIYADFESILEKTDDINKYQKHITCGFVMTLYHLLEENMISWSCIEDLMLLMNLLKGLRMIVWS